MVTQTELKPVDTTTTTTTLSSSGPTSSSASSSSSNSKGTPHAAIHKQYGGIHSGRWVDLFPASWHPYIQLARLSPPTALLLIYFPHIFGVLYGAVNTRAPLEETLRVSAILFGGSFFFSNAAHGWDDWADVPIDKLIPRTQKRPIVRGAITPNAALVFTAIQGAFAALFLLPLPPRTALYAVGTIIGTVYYPFAKRHIPCPQAVLGYTLANGISVGAAAMGADPLADGAVPSLLLASALWSVIYDTVYGSLDVKEDIKHGIGNTAVLFGEATKFWLTVLLGVLVAALGAVGQISGFGTPYMLISTVGCALTMGSMIVRVKLQDSASCWWWFAHGFWLVGFSITAALLTEYVPLVI